MQRTPGPGDLPLKVECSRLLNRAWVRLYDCPQDGTPEVDLLDPREVGLSNMSVRFCGRGIHPSYLDKINASKLTPRKTTL